MPVRQMLVHRGRMAGKFSAMAAALAYSREFDPLAGAMWTPRAVEQHRMRLAVLKLKPKPKLP